MARKKHSIALFEVIRKDKPFDRGATTGPAAQRKRPWFNLRRAAAVPPTPAEVKPAARKRPAKIAAERGDSPSTAKVLYGRMRTAVSRAGAALQSQFGNFAGPLLGAAAALVVCGGVLLARHFSGASRTTSAGMISTDELRRGPAYPEVLHVPGRAVAAAGQAISNTPAPANDRDAQQAGQTSSPSSTRQVNLNYVLVQSYAEEKTAIEARDFLNANGVPCTIERGVKNWRKDFYLVIGLQGFARISGPDYVAYRSRIESLSQQFAPHPHNYKAFSPQAIKWDRAD